MNDPGLASRNDADLRAIRPRHQPRHPYLKIDRGGAPRPRPSGTPATHPRPNLLPRAEDRQVDEAGAEAEHGAVQEEQPLVLACIAERSSSAKSVGGSSRIRSAISLRTCALWRRLNSGSVSGVIVYSTASAATDSRIASYSRVPDRDPDRRLRRRRPRGRRPGRSAVSIICRVRSDARPVQQLVADVAEGDDVVGDDPGVDVGDLAAGGAGRGPGS